MFDEADSTSRLFQAVTAGKGQVTTAPLTFGQLRLANYHGLIGLLANSPNPDLRDPAVFRYLELAGRQKMMAGHLRRILQRLHEAGIPAAVLKGPYMAESYELPGVRTFVDIDLLVPESRLADALEVIGADEHVPRIPRKRPKADKRDIPIHDPSGLVFNLDLHWDLFSYSQLLGCADGATAWAWDHARIDIDHPLGPLWHLPPEARIAFLSTHAVLDHRFRLILFRDLAELANQEVDWDAVVEFATRWGLRSFVYLAFRIAMDLAGARLPQGVLAPLRVRSLPMRGVEGLLRRADLVYFTGHRAHPLNLAIVLLHDSLGGRLRLAARAPLAVPQWKRRIEGEAGQGERDSSESRVLHVLPVDKARGAQTYAKSLRDSLDGEVEHRTATIFRSDAGALDADVDLGVTQGVGRRLGFSLTAMLRLRSHLRKHRPDIVVAHGGEALKYAVFATTKRMKLIYYKIGTSEDLLQNPLRRWFHRLLVRRADLVAGVSKEVVEEATGLFGLSVESTTYIPNGRDPALFSHQAAPIQESPVRFLFVGHLTRTKRPELFVEVIQRLRRRGIEAAGLVVGDGPLLDDLRLRSTEGIELLGSRNDVPELMAGADIFLFTSTTEGEGMPGVLIEAGFTGLPVVTTEVAGSRSVVEDGVTGLVVPVDDTEALVDAAERLAKDPELRAAMGVAARKRCLENFTLDSSVELWRRHLDQMLIEAAL